MSYIYDILANFNSCFFDFYDWNLDDDIVHIKKLPILKVDSSFLHSVKYGDVRVSSDLLDKIYKRSDFFKVSKNKFCYVCSLCDGCEAIIVRFDSKGCVIGRSSMLIDEENEVIDICDGLDKCSFDISVSSVSFDFFKTRHELFINSFILDQVKSMDYDKISYLYFDCFDEYESDVKKILSRIIYEVDNNFDSIYGKIYDFLKLTSINK